MTDILYESVFELNSIISEINSEFIFESIMLENDENKIIDVDYKEVNGDKKEESIQKKKSFLEKVKSAWKAFVAAMKRMIKSCIGFIKKNKTEIKETAEVKIYVTDRSEMLAGFKRLNDDVMSGKAIKKIIDAGRVGDEYVSRSFTRTFDEKKVLVDKDDAIRILEKQLNEAEKLISGFDKQVDDFLRDAERKISNIESTADRLMVSYGVQAVTNARNHYKELIQEIVMEIQEVASRKNDMQEKEK